MKYTKPQITNVESASSAIMNTGVGKVQGGGDSAPDMITNPAYSADE
jgi:hypothetical protein